MNSAEKQAVLHCLKSMIDEEACEECPLYGTTGTDHCEKDCVRLAINALSSSENPKVGHWIDIMVGDMPAQACDQCNTFYPLAYTGGGHKYCPNCGVKMSEIPTGQIVANGELYPGEFDDPLAKEGSDK